MVIVGRVGYRTGACGPVLSLIAGPTIDGTMVAHTAFRTKMSLANRTWVRTFTFVILLTHPTKSLLPIRLFGVSGLLVVLPFLASTLAW